MRLPFLSLFIVSGCFIQAQNRLEGGNLTGVNATYKLDKITINHRLELRSFFYDSRNAPDPTLNFDYALTDFTTTATRKIGFNTTVGAGYLLRFKDNKLNHRFSQHLLLADNIAGYKAVHRLVIEQTLVPNLPIEYRLRYRIALEFPLAGTTLDTGEYYITLNNEYLASLQEGMTDLEIRLVPYIGCKITDTQKIEAGIDYRTSRLLTTPAAHRFFLGINWHVIL